MPFDATTISDRLAAADQLEPLSNVYPSHLVSRSVGPAVLYLNSRLGTIVAAKNALQTALKDIEELENETRQKLNPLTNLFSPIFRLPAEVLLHIFQYGYAAWLVECDRQSIPSDPTPYLLAITETCRDWRADALSLPQFWRRIHVEWEAEKREAWLERAGGNAPLDIHMQGIDEERLSSYNVVETADVFRHTVRWRSISISHCGNPVMDRFLITVLTARTRFPILESVVVKLSPNQRGRALRLLNNALRPASEFVDDGEMYNTDEEEEAALNDGLPLLRHLVLHRADFSFEELLFHATSLEINDFRPSFYDTRDFGRSLMHVRTLKSLSLSNLSLSWDRDMCTPERGYLARKERLERLVLGGGNNKGAIRFVIHEMQAANLRYLRLWLPYTDGSYISDLSNRFNAFLGSSPLIETLIMYGHVRDCGELLHDVANDAPGTSPFLRHLQNLTLGPDDTEFVVADPFWSSLGVHVIKPFIERQLRFNPGATHAFRSLSIIHGPRSSEERAWMKERVHRLVITDNAPLEEEEEERRYKAIEKFYLRQGKVLDSELKEIVELREDSDTDVDEDDEQLVIATDTLF